MEKDMHIQRMKRINNRSVLDFGSNDEGRNLLYGNDHLPQHHHQKIYGHMTTV